MGIEKKEMFFFIALSCVQFALLFTATMYMPRIVRLVREKQRELAAAKRPNQTDDTLEHTLDVDHVHQGFGIDDLFIHEKATGVQSTTEEQPDDEEISCLPQCVSSSVARFVTDKTIYDGEDVDDSQVQPNSTLSTTGGSNSDQQTKSSRLAFLIPSIDEQQKLNEMLDTRTMRHVSLTDVVSDAHQK